MLPHDGRGGVHVVCGAAGLVAGEELEAVESIGHNEARQRMQVGQRTGRGLVDEVAREINISDDRHEKLELVGEHAAVWMERRVPRELKRARI